MKGLHAVHAIFKNGALIFADPTLAPQDGTEVVVTYFEALPAEVPSGADLLHALRGRGKGERLVEKLLRARREDREHDERSSRHLRSARPSRGGCRQCSMYGFLIPMVAWWLCLHTPDPLVLAHRCHRDPRAV